MKEKTTLSLRLNTDERKQLEALKDYLGEKLATRALLHVIRLFPSQHHALQETLNALEQTRADRDRLLEAVASMEQARADLLDTAAEIIAGPRQSEYEARPVLSMKIDHHDQRVRALGLTPDELSTEFQTVLAAHLYKKFNFSTGGASDFVGLPKILFLERMGEHKIPAFDLTKEELERDVGTAQAAANQSKNDE